MLDDMMAHFNESGPYDRKYFAKLNKCFHKFNDTQMEKSQDGFWKGYLDYYKSNGTNKDFQG
jgi:hypothetical protein